MKETSGESMSQPKKLLCTKNFERKNYQEMSEFLCGYRNTH